MEDEDFDYN
jgi:hypothetical protein